MLGGAELDSGGNKAQCALRKEGGLVLSLSWTRSISQSTKLGPADSQNQIQLEHVGKLAKSFRSVEETQGLESACPADVKTTDLVVNISSYKH